MDWPGILKTGTGQLKTDYPAALAFEKAGVTTYVVCNFGPRERLVTSSGGQAVTSRQSIGSRFEA